MLDLVLPYLAGLVATLVVLIVTCISFFRFQRAAANYERLEQNLPDACRYEDLQPRLRDAEAAMDRLAEDLAIARQLVAQKEDAETWLKENRQILLSLEAEREQQEQIRAELQDLKQSASEERERQTRQIQEVESTRLQLDSLKQQEADKRATLEELNSQVTSAKDDFASLHEQKAGRLQEIAELSAQLEGAQQRLQNLKEEQESRIATFNRQTAEAKAERESLQTQLYNLEEQIQAKQVQLESVRGQVASISAEIQGLHAERSAIGSELSVLKDDWRRMLVKTGQGEEADRQRTAELWLPVFNPELYETRSSLDEIERLGRVQQYLQSLGLQFPERVVWAFHTSLKVADVSPLVVLAGISGTGKSELPRRYAGGMGMHFLNMAVQPRWDSPQDMFGFFNYLENRYRATELGRALIQMDPYFATPNRGWTPPESWERNSLSGQMLLVLLDEMNLARVEYYFSEFLSRLEIRRGVDRDTADDRRKAEIALEIGATSKSNPLMHVFVDTNVLFVGTMNEDETTQTLSDKVVDRANVLRFGRPSRLSPSTHNGFATATNERIARKNWRDWCRSENDLAPDVTDQVNQWVSRLNDTLTRIRRPFAHRTHLAIRKYVANYPSLEMDGLQHAMSDQIEQKILPKFRGLDPSETDVRHALNDIRSILTELEDELLIQAIDQTRNEHQFVWMGVDRLNEEAIKS